MMSRLAGWTATGISQFEEEEASIECNISIANPLRVPFEVSLTTGVFCSLSANIYDVAGRHTAVITSGSFASGQYVFSVDGLNPGIYFIGVDNGYSISTHRAVVLN